MLKLILTPLICLLTSIATGQVTPSYQLTITSMPAYGTVGAITGTITDVQVPGFTVAPVLLESRSEA